MTKQVVIPGATWGDVFVSNGCIGCAYDNGPTIIVDFYSLTITNELVKVGMRTFEFNERLLFVRACEDRFGNVAVAGQGQVSGRFRYIGLRGVPDVHTYGTNVCDIDSSLNWCVQISPEGYLLNDNIQRLLPHEIWGSSQGMIQLLNGQPIWSDLARTSQPGMLYPYYEADVYIGEGATDPAHIQAIESGVSKNIYNGVAERPRSAYDTGNNVFAIASRSGTGVLFQFMRRPLVDVTVVIPPDPIPPDPEPEPPDPEDPTMPWNCVLPPQDVVRDYIYNPLRKFCQDYTVPPSGNNPDYPPGTKPYVNDEIHVNGLFMSDGLGYFQWGDTSGFVKTLVNPEDTRPWNEKAPAALNSLIKYMKQRVGDFT